MDAQTPDVPAMIAMIKFIIRTTIKAWKTMYVMIEVLWKSAASTSKSPSMPRHIVKRAGQVWERQFRKHSAATCSNAIVFQNDCISCIQTHATLARW